MQVAPHDFPPPVIHVFVDFENIHQIDPELLHHRTVHFTLLAGPRQKQLALSAVEKLTQPGAELQFIRLASPGKNALDFALAYYLGRAVLADPTGCFHIISRDKGYDPLIEHLRRRHIHIRRHDSFDTLTLGAPARLPSSPASPPPAVAPIPQPKSKAAAAPFATQEQQVLEHLRKPTTKRPNTRKRLHSYLISHLGNKISEAEVSQLTEHLVRAGHIAIDDRSRVSYSLDAK